MRYFSVRLIGAAVAAALLSTPALAAEYTGTLKKIKDPGTIVLGHRDASIPFSYLGNDPSQPIGYSHDLQLKVVEALKKELKLPSLKVKYNLVTSQTRIPLVQNGTVDLECGSTTNNLARQNQVAFAPTTYVTHLRQPDLRSMLRAPSPVLGTPTPDRGTSAAGNDGRAADAATKQP